MEVFICGHNSFNQLNLVSKSLKDFAVSKNSNSNVVNSKQLSLLQPSRQLSLPKIGEIDIHFTWSRCIVSITTGNGKHTTYVTLTDSCSEKKTSELSFDNTLCTGVIGGNGDILLQDTIDPFKFSVLHHGISQPVSLTVSSDGNKATSTSLHKVAGGHKDVYAVYDGVSFGKFQVTKSFEISPLNDGNGKSDMKQKDGILTIHHIDFVTPIKEVSCGKEHVLLLSMSGSVYSYGLSSRGQLGHGEIENETSPRLVDALDGLAMRTVVTGGWHSVAVSDIGDLYVWGWNESGQLGLKSIKSGENMMDKGYSDSSSVGIVATPICADLPNGENVKDVACGSRHTVVLTDSGQIFTCGWNGYGQLGLGDTVNRDILTRVVGLNGHRVFAGHWNTAFVCSHDQVD